MPLDVDYAPSRIILGDMMRNGREREAAYLYRQFLFDSNQHDKPVRGAYKPTLDEIDHWTQNR
jgi:hypothetical protein